MENADKIFGIPWPMWIVAIVAILATVIGTEFLKKWRVTAKVPGIIQFWLTGFALFGALSALKLTKIDFRMIGVYIVVGAGLNITYYKDFLRLKTVLRKVMAGELPPVPDDEPK